MTALLDTASAHESVPFDAEPYASLSIALPDSWVADQGAVIGGREPNGPGSNPVARTADASDPTPDVAAGSDSAAAAQRSARRGWNQSGSATGSSPGLISSITRDNLAATSRSRCVSKWRCSVQWRSETRLVRLPERGLKNWSCISPCIRVVFPTRPGPRHYGPTGSWLRRASTRPPRSSTFAGPDGGRPRSPAAFAREIGPGGLGWHRRGPIVALAGSADIANWRRAMDLVRGRPFEGLRSSDWPVLEGIGPAIEAAVVDVSGRLAGACLAEGDARGAEWSARKGLLVSPYDERLYRMLTRSSDLAGNPAGWRR